MVVLGAILAAGCVAPGHKQAERTSTLANEAATTLPEMTDLEMAPPASGATAAGSVEPASYDKRMLISAPVQIAPIQGPRAQVDSSFDPLDGESLSNHGRRDAPDENHYVALALARHPSIDAARQRVAAAQSRIPQARALPDPTFNNIFWPIHDQSLQTAAGRVGNQMALSQSIPWPKKLSTREDVASREVQIARAEVDRLEREITESVRLAYYEVWYATRALQIIEQTKGLVEDWNRVAEARYRSGGTQQDVLRARLELDRLQEQSIRLSQQRQVAQADLAALVQQPVELVPEVGDLDISGAPQQLEALVAAAERCNPELAGLSWELQRDRQQQRLACLQQYPDLQFGLQWGLVSDNRQVLSPVADGQDSISFNVGTTIPLWRSKIDAGIREAAHRTRSTSRRLDAERNALIGKLRRLLAQADALIEQREIYEQRIIPRAEDTLKLTMADWRGERADFFSLIETYRELLMLETQLARIEASLAGTLAQIERAVGCSP